jgi:cell division protease FtsH
VKSIVETAHTQALNILNANRNLLETIVQRLLETEVLEGKHLEDLLGQVELVSEAAV